MRATMSSALVFVLIAAGSPVRLLAASGDLGTFSASIEATASAFASSQSHADATASAAWSRLTNLPASSRIVIRTRDGQIAHDTFVEADDVSLTVLTGKLRRFVPRADIVEVTLEPKGSTVGAYIGASLGLAIGVGMAANIGLGCGGHCGGGAITGEWLAAIGLPVGLGLFGYKEFRERPEVIYLAP